MNEAVDERVGGLGGGTIVADEAVTTERPD